DPLPQVAAQVQDQVTDAVEARPGPPPHLLVIQLTQAVFDAAQGAFQFVRRRSPDGSGQFVGCHAGSSTSPKARTGRVPRFLILWLAPPAFHRLRTRRTTRSSTRYPTASQKFMANGCSFSTSAVMRLAPCSASLLSTSTTSSRATPCRR